MRLPWKNFALAAASCLSALSAIAAPTLNVTPGGIQGGNWVWDVSVTPDLALAGGSTPLAVELGFRLSSDPLISVANVNPSVFDFNTPGNIIFGWETLYGVPARPEGIEINCTGCTAINPATLGGHAATVVVGSANEIFTALGSVVISTPGPKPLLKVIALGPGNGGPLSSTIQWLGAYGGNGRIAQKAGATALNFDISAGSATQAIPEPTGCALLVLGTIFAMLHRRSR